MFEGYNLISVDNRREINLNSQNRYITELLITNYPPSLESVHERLFELGDPESSRAPATGHKP